MAVMCSAVAMVSFTRVPASATTPWATVAPSVRFLVALA